MKITRYPKTKDQSLKAWSTADEYLLQFAKEEGLTNKSILTYNDRFGYINCQLNMHKPISVISYKSQLKSHKLNLSNNNLEYKESGFISPLESLEKKADIVLMKIPKSLNLYELYLAQIAQNLEGIGIVYCSFMTRHFTKQLLTIASKYFEEVEQSLAWKKARVLILKKLKPFKNVQLLNRVRLNENVSLQQYYGVFSGKEIDHASCFFIENMKLEETDLKILDLASGNGVLALSIKNKLPNAEIHLVDDFYLAVESAEMNLGLSSKYFHYNDNLEDFKENSFDLVVSNPPFHFEYETNIEISLQLFKEVHFCLKKEGSFQLVANRHLNYGTHLKKLFKIVEIVTQNDKFEIYNCVK